MGIYRRSRVGGGRGIDRGVGWEGREWEGTGGVGWERERLEIDRSGRGGD